MADTDLFMECEEEELEPWQLIEDDVVDDTGGGMLMAVSNSLNIGLKSVFSTTSIGDQQSSEVGKKPMMTVLPSNNTVSPLMNLGNQSLIVTQNPSGMGSQMSMPPMYQPAAVQMLQDPKSGVTSTVTGQPILIATQGFTVKDLRSVQNPVGIVLNVQGGQGAAPYQTKPLTLVPGTWGNGPAATQFVKSAVGVPQLWSPVTSIRPATNAFPGTVTTVIPATVTIRSTVPALSQKSAAQTSTTQSHLQPKCLTQPMSSPQQQQQSHSHVQTPTQPRPQLHGLSQSNLLHHPHAMQLSNHDHKLVNLLQNTNLIRVKTTEASTPDVRPKPEEVVKSSVLPPVQNTTTTTTPAPQMMHKSSLNSTTPFKLPESNINNGVPIPKDCPKCNIHFNIMESLRVHMAYCCPQLLNSSTPSKSPQQQAHTAAPQTQPPPPSPTPPKPTQPPVLKLAESSQGKLIMLVDDFYYGRDEGSTYQMLHEMKTSTTFRCLSCLKRLKNNIRFMNHMKHHLELEQQNDESIENHTTCQHCFRQYATPFQLQCHIENVHSPYETTTKCKICELAFETEQLFLQHMKDTHKPGEMPYVCQVCEYRSSVYLEVDNHFRMIHEDTKNLLCPYCLKVLKNSCAYQQHYMKHQKKSVYPCNKCRLQFISAKEKMEHKIEHHKTFKKPKQLEGLQPGTKVTIRTSMGQARAAGGSNQEVPARKVFPPVVLPKAPEPATCSTVHTVASVAKPPLKLDKKKTVERMITLLIDMQEIRKLHGNQVCLECNFDITNINNISNHFPKYVRCSRCRYSTSCSRAYADHMISYHTQRGKPKYLMFGKMNKSGVLLKCSSCAFTVDKGDGDEMALHLDLNHEHGPCQFVTVPASFHLRILPPPPSLAASLLIIPSPAPPISSSFPLLLLPSPPPSLSSSPLLLVPSAPPSSLSLSSSLLPSHKVNHRNKGSEVAKEAAEDSDSWLPAADDESGEEEAKPDGDQKSSTEERIEETSGPAICEVKSPIVKAQEIKTVRLSTVCSTDYINARVSSRALDDRALDASTPPIPAASSDEGSSCPSPAEEGARPPIPAAPAQDEGKVKSPSPEKVEEAGVEEEEEVEREALSPERVAEVAKESNPEQLPPIEGEEEEEEEEEIEPEDLPCDDGPPTEQQFRVVLCALCCGVQAAADRHAQPRGRVEQWLSRCTCHLDSARVPEPYFLTPAAEERLLEWVLVQRDQQLPLTDDTFLRQLAVAASAPGLVGRHADYCPWAVGFFLRHDLVAHAKVTVDRRLPRAMEDSIQAFLEFAQRRANVRDFPRRMVANMDEIPIFLDPDSLSRHDGALGGLGLAGTGQPQFVVVFTILADGSLLPTMVFSRGGLPAWLKVPRDVLLEVKSGGHSPEDILRLWLAKVWRGHVAATAAQRRRSVLLLDGFREHTSDGFIEGLSRCNSLPLVIPSGCSSRVQPLDMCISQTFKNFLQKRWGEYVAEAKCYRDVYGDVLQSLLNWVGEAAEFVGSNAELVQQSFLAASVLSVSSGRYSSRRHKVALQAELVSFLQEQLELGGKAEPPSPSPSLDPRLLTRLFEADSDSESFYGFCEGDL